MAVFKYKLQNILDIKFRLEDQAKAAFATAMAKLNEEEDKLRLLQRRRDEYEEQGRNLRSDVLSISDLRDNTHALENLKEQILLQQKEVDKANTKVEQARIKLNEAIQERKIHEKLRERSFEEFVHEINAAESKEIDELVSYTYGERIHGETTGRSGIEEA